jgi:hypothetical protein
MGIRGVGCPCPIHGQFLVCLVSPAAAGDPGGSPVRSCRSRSEEGQSEMRPGDSDRAAHGANDIRSGPDPRVRDSGSPADCAAGRSAYLARKNSWQGQRTGSARRDVRLQTQRSGGILRRSIRPSHKACEWAKYRFSESPNRRNDICQQYDNDRRHDQPSRRSHNTSKQLAKHRRVSLGFSARGPSRSNITEKLLDR